MSANKFYDVIIIGSGPIGLACGIEAARNNLSHLILEAGALCNSVFNYPVNMTFFSTSQKLEIGDVPFVSIADKPTRREALEYYRRVKDHWKLNIKTYEQVKDVIKKGNEFLINTNKELYTSGNLIAATGFYNKPNMLNIPGEELPKVKHYYNDPHCYIDQRVAIIGSGNSAVDAALETFRKGAEVTMIIRDKKIDERVKYWVRPDIENRIKEGSVKAHFSSTVKLIREREIVIQAPEGEKIIPNDFVLAMTGYHPDYEFLKKIRIEFTNDEIMEPVYNKNNFETNVKNLFVAGVVCGGMDTSRLFIENSRSHAKVIFSYISGKDRLTSQE